jgi:PAS domain S-box-containing protein
VAQESSVQQPQVLIGLKREQLERLPWGIAKANRQGVFTYGNRAMCNIVGVESIEGKKLAEFFRGNDLGVVLNHFESRFSHQAADEYEVELTRLTDNVRIQVRCQAMPEINDRGEVIGSIAILSDVSIEDASKALHKDIEDLSSSTEIFQAIERNCKRIVVFDLFCVTLYSEDNDHYRVLYLHPEVQPLEFRWREMSPFEKGLVEKMLVEAKPYNIPDLDEWLARPEGAAYRDDPDTEKFRSVFQSSLSFPVIRSKRVAAWISFMRKRGNGSFNQTDEQHLLQLPLNAAVNMALHYLERDGLTFRLDLIKRIAQTRSTDRIAETIIDQIVKHYGWQNVSIFRPDEQERQFSLVKQTATTKAWLLPDDWHHPIDKGITGLVYRKKNALNVADVTAPDFKNIYLAICPESRSELCIPMIVAGSRVYWILNVEASQRNAFAKEEQDALVEILGEVAVVVELVSQTQIFTELLKLSKDSIIQTDFSDTIMHTNQATEALLGYSEDEMKGRAFADYFEDKVNARLVQEKMQDAKYVPNDEVQLRRKDGSEVSLLLSGTSLPPEIGLRIYVCNDLRWRKRMETLEILRQMYNEIASQIKTPLTLAFTWLSKLRTEISQDATDLLDKTVKQLHKVDLTFERLLFYERSEGIPPADQSLFDIPILVEKIKQEMPDLESSRIKVTTRPKVPPVRGDIFQIWFCLETLLAYLERFISEDGDITVEISSKDSQVVTVVRGRAPQVTGGTIIKYAETRWAIRAITEMALGEQMIRSFIEKNHGGKFSEQNSAGDLVEYTLALPASTREDAK